MFPTLWHHLVQFYHDCFDWPSGVVIGNLLASLLWVPVQWLGIHARLAAHRAAMHDRLDEQDKYILARFDAQDAVLGEIRDLLRSSDADLLSGNSTS